MNSLKEIRPANFRKSSPPDLLKQNNKTHRPVIITQNGEPRGILQDSKSFEDMRNAIGILKLIGQSEQEIRDGKSKFQQEVFKNIDHFLNEKMK